MKKNLRKNKKGFTLVEIIVVLLIIGILLAITIPSIMGYVGKAKDAQYIAEGRSGYVAAQTILAKEVAGTPVTNDNKDAILTKYQGALTPTKVAIELGELPDTAKEGTGTITAIRCELSADNSVKINGCSVQTTGTGTSKWVNFTATDGSTDADASVSSEPKYEGTDWVKPKTE